MYFDDHPPPHFHVITRKSERVSVLIDTLAIQQVKLIRVIPPKRLPGRVRTPWSCARAGKSIPRKNL
jgi:hypothetical protein